MKIVDYAEKQGKGEVILNFDIKKTEWHKISKDSNAGALHEILCKQPVLNKS